MPQPAGEGFPTQIVRLAADADVLRHRLERLTHALALTSEAVADQLAEAAGRRGDDESLRLDAKQWRREAELCQEFLEALVKLRPG